jgi:hypothetical protein
MRDASVLLVVFDLAVLALCAWALVDGLTQSAAAFPVAGKLTKPIWLAIVGVLGALTAVFGSFSLFGIAAATAAIVYLVDVRPAVRQIRPGGGPWG